MTDRPWVGVRVRVRVRVRARVRVEVRVRVRANARANARVRAGARAHLQQPCARECCALRLRRLRMLHSGGHGHRPQARHRLIGEVDLGRG